MALMLSDAFYPLLSRRRRPFFDDMDAFFPELQLLIPRNRQMRRPDTSVDVQRTDGALSLSFDTSAFAPEELEVNVEGDAVVVEGNHSSESAEGSVRRHFVQKFRIPSDVDLDSIRSTLLHNGHLKIEASAKKEEGKRKIPIGISEAAPKK